MDKAELGSRLARAREDAGMTQDGLGRAVNLDRTAITRLEKGERKLSVPELVRIAAAVNRPLSYFVSEPAAAVVSRRSDTSQTHDTTTALDSALEQYSRDIRTLLKMGLLAPTRRNPAAKTPRSHASAEAMAASVRGNLGFGDGPIDNLGEACETLGLLTYSAPLGEGGPDGGCVEVDEADVTLGAAVVNGDAPSGRRRMTLAHELGHWLAGDAYDTQASLGSERMINSFAIHFLAPRSGVSKVWSARPDWSTRDRALGVGAAFRLSWTATIGQLRNLGFVSYDEYRALSSEEPKRGDYARLSLTWTDELQCPYVSPQYAAACLNGYIAGRLTPERVLELLRGTLSASELPGRIPPSLEDLRRSFTSHAE